MHRKPHITLTNLWSLPPSIPFFILPAEEGGKGEREGIDAVAEEAEGVEEGKVKGEAGGAAIGENGMK